MYYMDEIRYWGNNQNRIDTSFRRKFTPMAISPHNGLYKKWRLSAIDTSIIDALDL